ncbi:cytochrome P450 [Streptomyces sp. ZEA17I]|uniref:cytochrome P450 n=1 Tax=Streptomyces sp. ZEA17I TaxID=2202516 RepID=UPI000D6F3EFA|nr:cytochrome P450 [Streptomyces sp. ZEA17I]PWS43552.1 cytochrome P450 [Streptomyces sp. ZEA17I]
MGDVVRAPWNGYLVTGFDACSQVLRGRNWQAPDFAWQERQDDAKRWDAIATREMTSTLARLNAPEHTCQRRSLGNLFDRSTIERLTPDVERHADRLLDELADKLRWGEADFVSTVSEQLPIHTIGSWLGLPPEDYPHILEITHNQVYAQELLPTSSELAVSAKATAQLRAYFTDLVARRRAEPRHDVLTGWIHTWDALEPDRERADEILYRLTMFVTIASLETTATLLTSMVSLLSAEPGRWAWLRSCPEHVDAAVDEVLRYDPPIHINTRIAAEDTVLAGVPIEKDSMVHVLYGAANHDPRRNPDPGAFDILRGGSHLTFGGGVHYCLGAALAKLEARTLLARMLDRFPALRTVSPPVHAPRMVFRRVTSLGVAL